ncbi:MAG TPA: 2Fe-2S iron-sulfur cluster-binding protein [Telluria sp.]
MATYRISLERTGAVFEARDDEPLLRAAERAGVALPGSCRNGTCRTCIHLLRAGAIEYLVEWPGLTREEKAAGLVLPCVAVPRSDIVLAAA